MKWIMYRQWLSTAKRYDTYDAAFSNRQKIVDDRSVICQAGSIRPFSAWNDNERCATTSTQYGRDWETGRCMRSNLHFYFYFFPHRLEIKSPAAFGLLPHLTLFVFWHCLAFLITLCVCDDVQRWYGNMATAIDTCINSFYDVEAERQKKMPKSKTNRTHRCFNVYTVLNEHLIFNGVVSHRHNRSSVQTNARTFRARWQNNPLSPHRCNCRK